MIMQRLYRLASRVIGRIFRPSHSVSRRAVARMDPAVRHALAGDVADEVQGTEDEWREVERELAEAREQLQASEAREQFLGMRTYKYQQMLNDQARRLKDEQAKLQEREERVSVSKSNEEEEGEMDPEEGGGDYHVEGQEQEILQRDRAAWDRRMVKWEEESDLLQSIQEKHKAILVECENMRRKIRSLEKRRLQFQSMQQECSSFVDRAAQVNENRETDSLPTPEVELPPRTRALPTLQPEDSPQGGDETMTLLVSDSEVAPPV